MCVYIYIYIYLYIVICLLVYFMCTEVFLIYIHW